MANKDLLRRALNVTANLPPGRREDPADQAPPDSRQEVLSPTDPSEPLPIGRHATAGGTPRTGPGSMLAFMTDQSEVHREVVRLRERMTEFEGADVARRLDPRQIVASKWANRDEAHFQTEAFAKLKTEIASAGGNVQPIKVRPQPAGEGGDDRWEIVFGHRRHRACLELGLPVLALIQQHLSDADLFVEMERENREREDLSAWEQGVMYMRALELGLFPSAKQMAAAIDRDMGNISRAMALAKLPGDVIRAFGSPLNLQFRWATPLKDAHQKDPERLLESARKLASKEDKPAPAEVFALLTGKHGDAKGKKSDEVDWKDVNGKRVAHLANDRKGRATLAFDIPLDASQLRKLVKAIDTFLGLKS